MTPGKTLVAIIGSGNIGTDLMIKVMRLSQTLEMGALIGVDPNSDGLARAARLGVPITAEGIDGLVALPNFAEIKIVFDATSAGAHAHHDKILRVHCGGQATIPIVAAINRASPVLYGEIVASIASKSAGPGTRANIDEFTETTALAIEKVGGARRGKAIIVLNPAEPPLIMRDTVYCLCEAQGSAEEIAAIEASIDEMVAKVHSYVPGYRLKQRVQFERIRHNAPLRIPEMGGSFSGLKVSVFLEVEGAAHYLPAYAGNLDIMTSAALQTAEAIVRRNYVQEFSA